MPHYCDTKVLEKNWLNWLVASATPCLEKYRESGILLTKVLAPKSPSKSESGRKLDPFWGYPHKPMRAHCFAIERPIFCNSYSGECDRPRRFKGSRPIACDFPPLTSVLDQDILDKMLSQGYLQERPTKASWDAILLDVRKICGGISLKFNLPSEDAHEELAAEAFVQVTHKIKHLKLIFTPGLAPVFNLLTTTIHRIMFSILNKGIKDRDNKAEHAKLITPLVARGQRRSRCRLVTRRICGSLIACPIS